MATLRFSINPEDSIEQVVIAAGAATVTKKIELTIDTSALVTDANGTVNPRPIKLGELIVALDNLRARIIKNDANLFE